MQKKSTLLNYLLDCAEEKREADGKKLLSANHFFLVVVQTLTAWKNGTLPKDLDNAGSLSELQQIEALLQPYGVDHQTAGNAIEEMIGAEGYNASADEFIFSKVKFSADSRARKNNQSVLDAGMFFQMILETPTAAIETYVLSAAQNQKSSNTAATGKTDSAGSPKAPKAPKDAKDPKDVKDATDAKGGKTVGDADGADTDGVKKKRTSKKDPEETGMQRLTKTVGNTRNIQKTLLESVFGQDQAIDAFVSGYFQSELMAQSRKETAKPQATFLFAGPPGVGKTFLAEKVAEALGLPFQRFDMSEYADKEANLEFCGSDNVYKNSKRGNVTGFVEDNPHCVLLFDEIEKAHINIIHLFLQLLDAGRLRDNYTDTEVSFTRAILIFTTNAGKNLYSDPSVTNLSSIPRKTVLKALGSDVNPNTGVPLFPAAICSRFASGNVVMFNHLDAANLYTIALRELNNNVRALEASAGLKIEIDPDVPTAILLSEGGKADARTVKGRANAFFHEELYALFRLLSKEEKKVGKLEKIQMKVTLDPKAQEIGKLFVSPQKPQILIFASEDKLGELSLPDAMYHVTDAMEDAKEILFNHDISLILCDVFCRRQDEKDLLNAEDVESTGRDFLTYALSRYTIPLYLLQETEGEITQEEFLSFAKLGVRDLLTLRGEGGSEAFAAAVSQKCDIAYQQNNMLKLARENKVLSYQTSQSISKDGKTAQICLFGCSLALATDTEDSKNILDHVSKPEVLFADVIGAEDAKKELTYFVEYLKEPSKYLRKGVRAPKGVLLYGPPGTGKTMLAKAMAGESDVTFLTAEGNQFLKRYVGEGSEAVHQLFASARKYAPSILFIDEIDAIGKDRNSSGNDSTGDVLTAFLTEMDGFRTDTSKPVFVLAATNYAVEPGQGKHLDGALLRRFDRRIYVDLPTKEERKRFLHQKAAKNKLLSLSEAQIENIAVRSTGMSLAELDSVFEMALRNALCSEDCIVDDVAFEEAFETFQSGEKKQWSPELLERTARHEAGHALLCWMGGEKPSYLTIVARANHGGYMQHGDQEGKALHTRKELLQRIRVSLAGRAAEMVYYGEEDGVSTGATGDLRSATRVAEGMICRYGMDKEIGLSYLEEDQTASPYYYEVRKRVNAILAQELEETVAIVSSQKAAIDAMVEALLERNHLKEQEIDEIFAKTVKI